MKYCLILSVMHAFIHAVPRHKIYLPYIQEN